MKRYYNASIENSKNAANWSVSIGTNQTMFSDIYANSHLANYIVQIISKLEFYCKILPGSFQEHQWQPQAVI